MKALDAQPFERLGKCDVDLLEREVLQHARFQRTHVFVGAQVQLEGIEGIQRLLLGVAAGQRQHCAILEELIVRAEAQPGLGEVVLLQMVAGLLRGHHGGSDVFYPVAHLNSFRVGGNGKIL